MSMDATIVFYRQVFTGLTEAPEENKDRAAEIYKYMLEYTLVEPKKLNIDAHLVALDLARWPADDYGGGGTEYKTLSVAGELHYASEMSSEADKFFAEESIDFTQTLPISRDEKVFTPWEPPSTLHFTEPVAVEPDETPKFTGPSEQLQYVQQEHGVASSGHQHVSWVVSSNNALRDKAAFVAEMLRTLQPIAEMNTIHEMVGSARIEVENLIKAAAKLREEMGM